MEHFWIAALALPAAFVLDIVLGDPRWFFPHPVRLIGSAAYSLERTARSLFSGPRAEKASGIAVAVLAAGGSCMAAFVVLKVAFHLHVFLGLVLYTYIIYAVISVGDMVRHVEDVLEALAAGELPLARERVSMLVSRDTSRLDEEGVVRAALESLFENTADGVSAPLFYSALGGPVLAVLYKAVNTLDSMFGYKNERYLYFGWAAARGDDVLSFIPARLAALAYLLAGMGAKRRQWDWKRGWAVLLKDRKKHDSPNSAWPEAAAAGVLGVRLGGADYYGGVELKRPSLNEGGRAAARGDLPAALALFRRASVLSLAGALAMAVSIRLLAGVLL